MDSYKSWADVPENLKTKIQLGQMGLRLGPGQVAVAYKRGMRGKYFLYEVSQAVPQRRSTEAQAAALARIKRMAEGNNESI